MSGASGGESKLVLASRSPQRRAILAQLGVAFTVAPADVPELAQGDPAAVAIENAARKARAVEGACVLGADTVVALGPRILPKPADEAQAAEWLRALAGETHEVHGGLCLRADGSERTAHAVTAVSFRALSGEEIAAYVGTGEWRGRAGGYAIQGRGAALVAGIEGDYFNVVGLPVAALVALAPGLAVRG